MRRLLAAILRVTADHLDPLPGPEPVDVTEPCTLPHYYPQTVPTWPLYDQQWTCSTKRDPWVSPHSINAGAN